MKAIIASFVFFLLLALAATSVCARDVYVHGYYRSDGTYVRPHIRSAPDNYRWNNYGPSQKSYQLMNPRSRDYDRDGTSNYLDMDSHNDGVLDDFDRIPYGR